MAWGSSVGFVDVVYRIPIEERFELNIVQCNVIAGILTVFPRPLRSSWVPR